VHADSASELKRGGPVDEVNSCHLCTAAVLPEDVL